jgi:membrane peptidoglycan carboxypeptidase
MLKKFLPQYQKSTIRKISAWILTGIIGLGALGLITFAGTVAILSIGLPDVTNLEYISADQSTQIFDKDGNLLYTIHGEENREQIPLDEISKYLVDATVTIEDDGFFEHGGFDIWALGKVAMYELFGIGTQRGGSTITQQYIKNTFLSPERTYIRKAKELILAIRLERAFSKEEILELYLNRIPYGNNAYGIEKAAEIYLNKTAKELTLGESALLAALPQAPTRYNPYGQNQYSHLLKEFSQEELAYRNIEKESDLEMEEYSRGLIGKYVDLGNGETVYIAGRSDIVLKRMQELDKITVEQRQEALNGIQQIAFNKYKEPIKHPHFVFYIKQILEEKYGKDVVERGGLKVTTTLDSELQDSVEKFVEEQGKINEESYKVNNAAVLTINAKTGHILAMVGSRDYFNEEIDGNVNVTLRPRQPGSSFKPIMYARAFLNGYGPGSVIYDIPTKIGPDAPQNYDGKWQGQITIRQALGKSRNIPAVKAYFLAGEQDEIIDLAAKMGIKSLNKKNSYGYPLALGAGEIPLMEMVTAYGVFANNGKKPEVTGILKVENSNGDILEEWKQKEFEEVLDPQVAYLINNILSDREASVGSRLFIDGKINAAKTGTSTKENKKASGGKKVHPSDGWTMGYSPTIVTGVWIGNTDGTALGFNADGYNAAALIFQAVMKKALEDIPAEPFPEPKGIQHIQISKASGKLPGPNTPKDMVKTEIFASFSVPTEIEDTFFKVKLDKISGLLATEFTPPDAVEEVLFQNHKPIADMLNWANEIKEYYETIGKDELTPPDGTPAEGEATATQNVKIGTPPTEYDNVHTAQTAKLAPKIKIVSPSSQSTVEIGNLQVGISLSAPNGVEKVEFYLDDQKKFFSTTSPFTGYINISKFIDKSKSHFIVAKVVDSLGYGDQSAIEIKVVEKAEEVEEI